MDDFKSLLENTIKKAATTSGNVDSNSERRAKKAKQIPAKPAKDDPAIMDSDDEDAPAQTAKRVARKAQNVNRITVNLFEADARALAVIKELLSTAGHDFTSRSDSIKIGLRLAAKAKPEELARILDQVKSDDKRFKN